MAGFVFDRRKRPPMPCPEQRARVLAGRGRAVVLARGGCNRSNLTLAFIVCNSEKGARGYRRRCKIVRDFRSRDTVRAEVPHGKQAAVHVGCVAVRSGASYHVEATPPPRRRRRGFRRGNSR